MISHGKEIKVFSGNSNPKLANQICNQLFKNLGDCTCANFADGECSISVHEPVRGADVFIVQSTCKPVNDNLMELLRYPIFRLCPPGPQGKKPRPHLRKACCKPHHRRRR